MDAYSFLVCFFAKLLESLECRVVLVHAVPPVFYAVSLCSIVVVCVVVVPLIFWCFWCVVHSACVLFEF